jgi:prepilin-type N-terminal cleavage/methylation domain-containing protein
MHRFYHTSLQNSSRGYTLVELLVAIAIILIVVPVIYTTIQALYANHGRTLAKSFALVEATTAMEEVVRDIRATVYAENGALPLVTIGTSTLVIYADTDLDRRVERVHYYLDGDTLQKGVVEPTSTSSYPLDSEVVTELASGITNNTSGTSVFKYYSATSTEITLQTQILDVRRVEVTLEAEAQFRYNTGDAALRSSAAIRNLKDTY